MTLKALYRNVKIRKKCNLIPLWIFCHFCFLNGLNVAIAAYSEADDLINELDRPSEYRIKV